MNNQPATRHLTLLAFGIAIGLLVMGLIVYESFGLSEDLSFDQIKAITDWQGILFVDLLIGVSVVLLILELRWDALRVLLTVIVALVFGYLMTAFFNLDTADRFKQGDFRIRVMSDVESPIDLGYEENVLAVFNAADAAEPLTEAAYTFLGTAGDVVTILAYATDPDSGLNIQVALVDAAGETLELATEASRRFTRQYSDYLTSENDAVIKDFALPEDGLYTIVASPETDSAGVEAEFGVTLLSDSDAARGLLYNGPPVGDTFNKEDVDQPLTEANYTFIGGEGDVVTILAYAFRANIAVDLEAVLYATDGSELAANNSASEEQVAAFSPDLKSTRDAIMEGVVLPADGTYSITVRPERLTTGTRLSEMIKATNEAYDAFLFGPLSRMNRWVIWIRDAITLIMLGLAIAIVFRAEQFSLGAEGQLYFGVLVSGVVTLSFSALPRALLVPLALLSAATAGFLWGLLPGALKAYLGANELVSTLMLNVIAQRFYEMVLTFQLQPEDAGYTSSDWIDQNGLLAPIIDLNGDTVTIAVFLLIFMVLFTWMLIQRTPIGYEIRMIGANLKFADYGGVNTKRTIMLVMAISGILAGLAGAHLAMGIHRKLLLNISMGLAFEGVVVALLARNNPLVVPFTGLLYAYLRTGAQIMERDANISAEVVRIIQAVVILLITAEALVTFFRRRQVRQRGSAPAPGADGEQGGTWTQAAEESAHV